MSERWWRTLAAAAPALQITLCLLSLLPWGCWGYVVDDLPVPQAKLDHSCRGLDSVQVPYPTLKSQPSNYSCPRYLVCCNGAAYSRGCTNCVADNQPIQLCEYSLKQAVYNRTSGACVPWWVGGLTG